MIFNDKKINFLIIISYRIHHTQSIPHVFNNKKKHISTSAYEKTESIISFAL